MNETLGFKAHQAAIRERVLRRVFGQKVEARLAEVNRGAAKRRALDEKGSTDEQ
ncbi:hypothetical protein [Mesorhizobium sp. Cs1321R2N1]|uniref:hypothetical protein n=1 Tax=Mesorhizobium sp. Cs1321R2N1 TaxID=3015174 RepID=UPI00301D53F1